MHRISALQLTCTFSLFHFIMCQICKQPGLAAPCRCAGLHCRAKITTMAAVDALKAVDLYTSFSINGALTGALGYLMPCAVMRSLYWTARWKHTRWSLSSVLNFTAHRKVFHFTWGCLKSSKAQRRQQCFWVLFLDAWQSWTFICGCMMTVFTGGGFQKCFWAHAVIFNYIIMSILITDTRHQSLSLCTKNAEIFPNFTEEFKVSWIIT